MSDAPDRRERKSFEPPPWEREQFEELERLRRERQPEQEDAGTGGSAGTAPEAVAPKPAPRAEEEPRAVEARPAVPQESERHEAAPTDDADVLDEKMLEAMFVQLRAEQPARDDSLWKIGLVFSGVVAVVGSVLMVWGLVALVRTGGAGPVGAIGGAILLMFGGLFLGLGVWTAVRSLKERGVL